MNFKKLNIYEYQRYNEKNRIEYLIKAQKYEKEIILSSNKELSKFVEFAGNNYMYNSIQLLSQYHFKPNAKAMTTYEEWEKMGRQIKRGKKHTPTLIKQEDGNYKAEQVFDVKDTVEIDKGNLRFERWEYEDKYIEKRDIKNLVEEELSKLDDTEENLAIKYFVYRFVDARTDLNYLRQFDDYKNILEKIPTKYVRDNFLEVLDKSLEISKIILDDINKIIDNYKNNELEKQVVDDRELVTNIENVLFKNSTKEEYIGKNEDNLLQLNNNNFLEAIRNISELGKDSSEEELKQKEDKIQESKVLDFSNINEKAPFKNIENTSGEQHYQKETVANTEKQINNLNNKINNLESKVISSGDKVVGIDIENEKILLLKSPYNSNIKTDTIISDKILNSHIYLGNDVSDIIYPLIEKYDEIKHLNYEYTLNNDYYNGLLDINRYDIDELDPDEIPIHMFETHKEYYEYAIQFESFREKYQDYEDYISRRFNDIYSKYNRPDYSIELLEYNRQEIDDILDKNGKYLVIETIDDYSVKGKTTIGYLADEKEDEESISDYIENFVGAWYRGKLAELNIISFNDFNGENLSQEIENTNYINTSLLKLNYSNSETLDKIKEIYPEYNNFQTKEEIITTLTRKENISYKENNVKTSEIEPVNNLKNENIKNFVITEEVQAEKLKPSERLLNNLNAIKLLKGLEKDDRTLTEKEQKTLANYVGWGGLVDVFDEDKKGQWEVARDELKLLLTEEEYRRAKESTLTAFYTPKYIIDGIYKALENFGFKGGKILEPSCAIGNFIGNVPESMNKTKFYGVELDSISGKIAKKLYPESDIKIGGYEENNFKNNTFDVAIGNIPFGNYKVFDKEYSNKNLLIHDYFFAKTIDKVRPGGIVSFITSTGTLDKRNNEFRKYISERCDLIGAIRLPSGVFKGVAGTEVASDIIFLQKKEKLEISEPNWLESTNIISEGNITYNRYFEENREHMLADIELDRYRGSHYVFKNYGNKNNLEEFKKDYINQINTLQANYKEVTRDNATISLGIDTNLYKNYSFFNYEGNIYYNDNYNVVIPEFNKKEKIKVNDYIELDNTLKDLIELQKENCSNYELKQQQDKLNTIYENFISKYGNINSRVNERFFKEDSNYFLLSTLEKLDDKDKYKVIGKSDIFTKRTIKSNIEIDFVENTKDALILSINNYAGVNLDYISKLVNKDKKEVIDELKDEILLNINSELVTNLASYNLEPLKEMTDYVIKDEFLTGNIRNKINNVDNLLDKINYNINQGKDFNYYKELLEEYRDKLVSVIPEKIQAGDIDAKIGANWIPVKYYNDFILENFTPNFTWHYCEVKYSSVTSSWKIENKKIRNDNTTKWFGTEKITAGELLEDLLNLKASKVMDKKLENGEMITYVDEKETFLAQQKQEEIKFKFKEWIFSDKKRRDELVEVYNNKFNNIVSRKYDGSNLLFSGMNPEVNLREHQKNAIARTLLGGNTLLAHVVGAGKTYEMVASAMESKRIGIANKSMLVVPNHLTEQIGREFLQLYPSANILIATKKDFEPANRKKFTGKIATGDYDAVIVGHTQFEKIPLSKERRIYYIQKEINYLSELIKRDSDKFTIKQAEQVKNRLTNKLTKLIESKEKDDVLNFEDLGVDRLYVDEAHSFKNLYAYTKLHNISGISQTEAMKSSDMYMKCSYMNEKTNYKGVIFATGTAISNTMVEMFTMQRYLQGDKLAELGLSNFDDWISSFGEIKNSMELKPTGQGYQVKTRLSSFSNLPELITIFKEVADIKTKEDLDLPIPKANYHTVITKASEEQKEILETFVERAEMVKTRSIEPTEDNMLKITNDGKKLALDIRLFNPNAEDLPESKVNKCVENVVNIYKETEENKSTQVIFCDMSTPSKEFNLYDDIKEKLINKGIKEEEISFIHDAKNETQKTSMFEKVKKGEIRVLLGSTAKMGAGTNIQNKLIALHDLDVPWRPSDLEQRAGRIVRQGNENKEVDIYRYVTENTFDSYLWQTIENKQRFISQVLTSKEIGRVSEDVDEVTLDYAEIKALATGNPLIKEKMQVDLEVQKLKMMYSNYTKNIHTLEDDIENKYPSEIKRLESSIAILEKDYNLYSNNVKNTFIVADKEYSDLKEAEKIMIKYVKTRGIIKPTKVAEYKGFDVVISQNIIKGVYECKLKGSSEYSVNVAFSKTDVNIARIEEKLNSIGEILRKHKHRLKNVKNTLLDAKEKVKIPFEKKEELKTLLNRQAELNYIFNNSTEEKER